MKIYVISTEAASPDGGRGRIAEVGIASLNTHSGEVRAELGSPAGVQIDCWNCAHMDCKSAGADGLPVCDVPEAGRRGLPWGRCRFWEGAR